MNVAIRTLGLVSIFLAVGFGPAVALAQGPADSGHTHHHGDNTDAAVKRPRVFLDKSPRIVWYQLNRLSNEQLLLVERSTDDPKYVPVYEAILTREGMPRQHQEEALAALVKLNRTDAVGELLRVVSILDDPVRFRSTTPQQRERVARRLVAMLLRQPAEKLRGQLAKLREATQAESAMLRAAAFAGMVVAGDADGAWELAQGSPQSLLDFLSGVPLIPAAKTRSQLREQVVQALESSDSTDVRRAAVTALATIPVRQSDTFRLVAGLIGEEELRPAVIQTLLSIPQKERDPAVAHELVDWLVRHAESTPAAERTTDEFIAAMQLADQLLALVPVEQAKAYRQRLRNVTVRVVVIHTVEEEMRYDTPYFAVEAGRPVQVILRNEDIMPHNLVITVPGALREVAEAGQAVGPEGGSKGLPYVPDSEKVLFATHLVPARRQERLTFTAPQQPGEYPYVCTFPRHWMRMYGVMVVVPDLDAWLKNPTVPADPIGNTRSFVKSWTLDDFRDELEAGLRGRSREIGERIFKEATCSQCHKYNGQGGAVGPELTDVFKRWKGDRLGILREILDPSHKIDPQYAVHIIALDDGQVITGIVKDQDQRTVTVIANPEDPKPVVVQRDKIEEMIRSDKSMMPKALLDRFTKDEIYELLAFLLNEPAVSQ